MEKVLSQDEIDALLKGVATGEVETEHKTPPPPTEVTLFNFGSHDRVVRGRMAALDIIHDRFVKLFAVTFSAALHRAAAVTVKGMEIVKFGVVLNRLPLPSSLTVLRMDPLRGHALIAMEAPLVYILVDHYFGGSVQTHIKPEGRDFTPIQRRIVRNITKLALGDLEKAWKAVYPVKPDIVRMESNPEFAMVVAASELVVVFTIGLDVSEDNKDFLICYPYSMLEPIKEKLQTSFMSDQVDVDRQWAVRFREELQYCPTEISVELGEASIEVGDLMNFAPGDVIVLDKSVGDSLVASVEGVAKFMAVPGTRKGQQAIQVTGVMS
jgi:flagellar motor switch protein FliM